MFSPFSTNKLNYLFHTASIFVSSRTNYCTR